MKRWQRKEVSEIRNQPQRQVKFVVHFPHKFSPSECYGLGWGGRCPPQAEPGHGGGSSLPGDSCAFLPCHAAFPTGSCSPENTRCAESLQQTEYWRLGWGDEVAGKMCQAWHSTWSTGELIQPCSWLSDSVASSECTGPGHKAVLLLCKFSSHWPFPLLQIRLKASKTDDLKKN